MPIVVRDLVEVVDEASPLYHRLGVVVGHTRVGRPVVEFRRRRRTWRHPIKGAIVPVVLDAAQLGTVPPLI